MNANEMRRIALLFLMVLLPFAASHATMKTPRERGALNVAELGSFKVSGFPKDSCHHCNNGGGTGEVKKASNGTWTSWEPLNPALPFRRDAGFCGDKIRSPRPRRHEKGGLFGAPASMPYSVVYKMGQKIDIEIQMSTNHLGHFTYFLCDVGRCGGDVTEKCFQQGHCKKLLRAVEPDCESASEKRCSPIDPKFPGRWYIPQFQMDTLRMKYQLPKDFKCKDCVMLWYWATANSCFDRGVQDYFKSYPSYNLKSKENMELCGKSFPEEFWNCADLRITGPGVSPPSIMPPTFGDEEDKDDDDGDKDEEKEIQHRKFKDNMASSNTQLRSQQKTIPVKQQNPVHHRSEMRPTFHSTPSPTVYSTPPTTVHSTPPATVHSTPPATVHSTPPATVHSTPPATKNTGVHQRERCRDNSDSKRAKAGKQQTRTPGVRSSRGQCQGKWKQCGGKEYSGLTMCCTGHKCVKLNDYYSQCQAQ